MAPLLLRQAFLAAALISGAAADFHLLLSIGENVPSWYFTCPSNYWTNKCWCDGDRRSSESFWSLQTNGEYKLTLENICGVPALDFWYRSETKMWEAYVPNANGNVEATCFRQPKTDGGEQLYTQIDVCFDYIPKISYGVFDGWVCYSEICGHA